MWHRRLCKPAASEHTHTLQRNLNLDFRQWMYTSCTSGQRSSAATKQGIPENSEEVERRELPWRHHYLDPTLWQNCKKDKKSVISDFRHSSTDETSWLTNYKPTWVDAQLPVLDSRIGPAPSNPFLQNNAGLIPTLPVCQGYGMAQGVMELCENGKLSGAVDALSILAETQSRVSTSLLYRVIQRCGAEKNLVLGRRLDDLTVKFGYESNAFLGNHILRMYASQGELQEAMKVFSRVAKPSPFMWFSIISAQAKHGEPSQAIQLYNKMCSSGVKPNGHIFVAALQACAKAEDVVSGRQVHADALGSGVQPDCFVCTCLVDMYAKCGELDDARRVFDSMVSKNVVAWTAMIDGYAKRGELEEARRIFDSMVSRNVVTWNAMIAAYAEFGLADQAFALYAEMEKEGRTSANRVTYICLLKACASAGDLQQGRRLHSQIVEKGVLEGDTVVGNCLINMYTKCGKVEEARLLFDSLATRNAVTWNAMMSGYAEQGLGQEALHLYESMEQEGLVLADGVTFACLLKACAGVCALQQGRQLHSKIVERGLLDGDTMVGNSLVNMYAKCGQLENARMVFDSMATRDAVTWNAMISGYAEHGLDHQALVLYASMEQEGVLVADSVTFACLFKACASAGALQQGKRLHAQVAERGLLVGGTMVGNCLVTMYAKCGQVEDARMVFDSMPTKDAVTWNAMIRGYAENELGQQALTLYVRMEQDGLMLADSVTYSCLLKACASAGALQQGRQLHSQILERGLLEGDTLLGNCLVNLYAKCGKMVDAHMVFDSLAKKDVVSWTAMISGYGVGSEGHMATVWFENMLLAGIQPDDATFSCVLAACSREGLVSKGRQYFDAMVSQYGLNPTIEHHVCMVDLLGRAGHLDEAEKMLSSDGCRNDVVGLMSLLTACSSHGDIERGARCFETLRQLDPQNASPYVLMANAYADADRWADVDRIERLRLSAGARKKPAMAGIEVNRRVETFVVGQDRGDVSCKVRTTNERLKEEGNHVPQTKVVLKPLSDKEKEDDLCGHAEKLALAYGLLNTPDGTPLLVTKNLRMCADCHSSTQIMSRVEKRDIVVRDAYRVHHFQAGSCSCNIRL